MTPPPDNAPASAAGALETLKSQRPSIALRLGALMSLLLALIVGGAIFATYRYGRNAADEAFDSLLTGAALQISERILVIDGQPVVDIPLSAFELLALAREDRVFYRIVGPNEETITGYDALPLPSEPKPHALEPILYDTRMFGAPVRAVALVRELTERSMTGQITIVIAHTTRARTALARQIATHAVTIIAISAIGVLLLALLAVRIALRPLERIEREIMARDPLDLSPFPDHAPREVEALVASINRFMARLDRRVKNMQSFVADAAHQMRTPITALRAQAELAADEADPRRLKALQKRIRTRAAHVSRLADQLLSHAMVNHRADAQPHELIDLRRVAVEAEREIRAFSNTAAALITLELAEEEIWILGDSFSLREAVKNLLNNALVHGAAPVIMVVAKKNEQSVILSVGDHGAGIAAAYVPQLGKRFARASEGGASAGLGLAIVHEVALAHGGSMQAMRREGVFWIDVILPRAKERA